MQISWSWVFFAIRNLVSSSSLFIFWIKFSGFMSYISSRFLLTLGFVSLTPALHQGCVWVLPQTVAFVLPTNLTQIQLFSFMLSRAKVCKCAFVQASCLLATWTTSISISFSISCGWQTLFCHLSSTSFSLVAHSTLKSLRSFSMVALILKLTQAPLILSFSHIQM